MYKYIFILALLLRWQLQSVDEDGVYVFRSLHNNNQYNLIATLPRGSKSYTDKNVKKNTKVCYMVMAFTLNARSPSNEYCTRAN